MAKKKVSKKTVKKNSVKKSVSKKSSSRKKRVFSGKAGLKTGLVWRKFLFYLVLVVVSYVLSLGAEGSGIWEDLFLFLALLFAFISIALLVVLIAGLIIKKSK